MMKDYYSYNQDKMTAAQIRELKVRTIQPVNMDRHFPCLHPLTTAYSKDLQLKTRRDMPHQKVINKIIDHLNSKTMHFCNLPFALDTLRNGQLKDPLFSNIIKYL